MSGCLCVYVHISSLYLYLPVPQFLHPKKTSTERNTKNQSDWGAAIVFPHRTRSTQREANLQCPTESLRVPRGSPASPISTPEAHSKLGIQSVVQTDRSLEAARRECSQEIDSSPCGESDLRAEDSHDWFSPIRNG